MPLPKNGGRRWGCYLHQLPRLWGPAGHWTVPHILSMCSHHPRRICRSSTRLTAARRGQVRPPESRWLSRVCVYACPSWSQLLMQWNFYNCVHVSCVSPGGRTVCFPSRDLCLNTFPFACSVLLTLWHSPLVLSHSQMQVRARRRWTGGSVGRASTVAPLCGLCVASGPSPKRNSGKAIPMRVCTLYGLF